MQHKTQKMQSPPTKTILAVIALALILFFGKGGLNQLFGGDANSGYGQSVKSTTGASEKGANAAASTSRAGSPADKETTSTSGKQSATTITSVEDLVNTENFADHALEHIFYGQINAQGNATGYHHESFPDAAGTVIEDTRTQEDSNGVYEGKVVVSGVNKSANKGYSSFFPQDWTAQQVVDAINEAYEGRALVSGNTWSGYANGIEINMYLANDKRIISAFPIYEGQE